MKTILFFVFLFVILRLVSRDWKAIRRVMFGWGITESIDFLYDFPFWLYLQHHYGITLGSIYASIGAIILNLAYVVWYQASDEDWLGVNLLEQMKKGEKEDWADKASAFKGLFLKTVFFILFYLKTKIFKLVVWSLNKTELTTFLIFSIFTDAFKTTIFMRHGKLGGKLNRRDTMIFVVSTGVGCTIWSFFNIILGETAHLISIWWKVIFG